MVSILRRKQILFYMVFKTFHDVAILAHSSHSQPASASVLRELVPTYYTLPHLGPCPSVSCSQTIHRIFSLSSFSSSSLSIPPHLTWLASSILLRFQIIYNPHKSTYFPHLQLCECMCVRDRCVCMSVYMCGSVCVDQVSPEHPVLSQEVFHPSHT